MINHKEKLKTFENKESKVIDKASSIYKPSTKKKDEFKSEKEFYLFRGSETETKRAREERYLHHNEAPTVSMNESTTVRSN